MISESYVICEMGLSLQTFDIFFVVCKTATILEMLLTAVETSFCDSEESQGCGEVH